MVTFAFHRVKPVFPGVRQFYAGMAETLFGTAFGRGWMNPGRLSRSESMNGTVSVPYSKVVETVLNGGKPEESRLFLLWRANGSLGYAQEVRN